MSVKPYRATLSVNGKQEYFGSFTTKEEADRKRAEVRAKHPRLAPARTGAGKKKGAKDPKVKCPSCSTQISIHRVSVHYKACKKKRG